ncbi:MAG TPA: cupredoxin domain-containing protein, partial [Stellaceae bacterium]|nr:cupredoxin domain-containing protein [Stellaceae bacterium]
MSAGRTTAFLMLAALLLPSGASATDWSNAKKVTVATVDYAFKPASLTFHQGATYRLRVRNQGKETHEFTAPEFFKAIEMRDTKPLNVDQTEIVVQPGQRKDLYFVARQTGSYKLICSDHDWAGMVGDITIS